MARQRTRFGRDEGAAAVEFALVSVLLFLLLFGIIDFGLALFRQQAATHAAREGARRAAVGVDDCTAFEDYVRARAEGADVDSGVTGVVLTFPTGTAPGQTARVQVKHNVDLLLISGLIPGIPDALSLTQTAEARIEQQSDEAGGC